MTVSTTEKKIDTVSVSKQGNRERKLQELVIQVEKSVIEKYEKKIARLTIISMVSFILGFLVFLLVMFILWWFNYKFPNESTIYRDFFCSNLPSSD